MKLKELLPTLKPGLVLAIINILLCAVFAVCAALALGGSLLAEEFADLSLPLLPIVVLGATPAAVLAWIVFGCRIRHGRSLRFIIAAIGTIPLLAIVGITVLGTLWFASLPGAHIDLTMGSLLTGIIAVVATATCVACVAWTRPISTDPDPETEAN